MRDKNLLQRSHVAWLALGISLAAGVVACSDDDTPPIATVDSGAGGSVTRDAASDGTVSNPDATKDTGAPDSTNADVSTDAPQGDAGSGGAGGSTGVGGAAMGGSTGVGGAAMGGSDAGVGGTATGGSDAGVGGSVDAGPDVAQTDASPEGGSDAQPDVAPDAGPMPPLELCKWLDEQHGLSTPAECETHTGNSCDDRAGTWIDEFWRGWMDPGDCRILGTINTLTDVSPDFQITTWTEDVANWTLFFFGCPNDAALRSHFALVPKARMSWPYTASDLHVFGESFIAHAQQVLTTDYTPFDTDQLAAINARLEYLENYYGLFHEGATSSAAGYSSSTCVSGDQ